MQSCQIHDGQEGYTNLMGDWQLLSLDSALSQWKLIKKLLDEEKLSGAGEPTGPVKPVWWSIKWVPVGYNGAGDLICIDMDPPPGDQVGQVISFWHTDATREVLSESFSSWLDKFADELKNGKYVVEDDELVFKADPAS